MTKLSSSRKNRLHKAVTRIKMKTFLKKIHTCVKPERIKIIVLKLRLEVKNRVEIIPFIKEWKNVKLKMNCKLKNGDQRISPT